MSTSSFIQNYDDINIQNHLRKKGQKVILKSKNFIKMSLCFRHFSKSLSLCVSVSQNKLLLLPSLHLLNYNLVTKNTKIYTVKFS